MQQILRALIILSLSIIYANSTFAADVPYTAVFLIDGARGDLIHELAAAGKLPNIQKLFVDGGLDVQYATTVFPTTSTNAYQAFMTGLFPGHAGIPYLARYSRTEQESIEYLSLKGIKIMNADLLNWYQLNDPTVPFTTTQGSLFNLLSDYKTASLYATFRRDATLQAPSFPVHAAWSIFVLGNNEEADTLAYLALKHQFEGPIADIPHLSLTALLAVDELAHKEGAHHPRVLAQFETIDRMIGDFWKLLEKRGLADKTYIVLVGDHGNHDIDERSYLRERLIKRGIAIRSRHMRPPHELAINARGVSTAIISVAGKEGWKTLPTIDDLHHVPTVKKHGEVDLIEYLRAQPETDLLLVRDGNHRVRIYNATMESTLTTVFSGNQYWYSYTASKGRDPLQYADDPKLAALVAQSTPLTAAQWLPLTADKQYGDAVVQIGQIFTDGRVGDLMIVPKKDWVFRHEKANTHGSLMPEDMHIPIMMHGPTITPQKPSYGRSVDVMPTILAWYGKTAPTSDGRDLLHPDVTPSHEDAAIARSQIHYLQHWVPSQRESSKLMNQELTQTQNRVAKLEALLDRCHTCKLEDRLTKPDRPKKMRVSTCEVVDLALKTAYEDRERLSALVNPLKNATHNTLQRP